MTVPETQPPAAAVEDKEKDWPQRLAELAEAVAARDTFIAIAAHELRNPMTPILGQIDLLLAAVRAGRCPPEQVEARLERLQQAIHRYLSRANVLLNVSRITTGKLRLEPVPLDLAQLLREIAAAFAETARQRRVPITVTVPDCLPGTWDQLALEQIIDNLLSNALKYGGRTPVALSAAPCGDAVRLQVRDHGGGIPAADRARIFQRFERAVGQQDQRSGFGIGLWVVGQLVDAMGGTVAVADAEGGGTVFTVTLPRHVKEPCP